ncbi:hypothetical protein ARAM_006809 [Aspergillus rambellii]|uniref:Uncharacterized protein n=1 Tax=Aspergillus rambellii TaxID=308745 RepID=A0A0F8UN56_9EURO|nr:hypothetical protein ARAM_006809 [Aspergillus rambellii]
MANWKKASGPYGLHTNKPHGHGDEDTTGTTKDPSEHTSATLEQTTEEQDTLALTVTPKNTPSKIDATSTPRKRGRKPGSSTNPKSRGSPVKRSKKETPAPTTATATATAAAKSTQIPTSYNAAGPADRLILRMRDEEKRPWAEITKAYVDLTAVQVGVSSIQKRYKTMKANFVSLSEEDTTRFLKIKKDIEDRFDLEKWARIAEVLEQESGTKYPAAALLKKFKELNRKGAATGTTTGTTTGTGAAAAAAAAADAATGTAADAGDETEDNDDNDDNDQA